jgi:hypothetical protein
MTVEIEPLKTVNAADYKRIIEEETQDLPSLFYLTVKQDAQNDRWELRVMSTEGKGFSEFLEGSNGDQSLDSFREIVRSLVKKIGAQ